MDQESVVGEAGRAGYLDSAQERRAAEGNPDPVDIQRWLLVGSRGIEIVSLVVKKQAVA